MDGYSFSIPTSNPFQETKPLRPGLPAAAAVVVVAVESAVDWCLQKLTADLCLLWSWFSLSARPPLQHRHTLLGQGHRHTLLGQTHRHTLLGQGHRHTLLGQEHRHTLLGQR